MRKVSLLLSACCLTVAPALAATMASQPWVTNRIAEAEARVGARIVAATNAIPHADLAPATNYTDHALGMFAATGAVTRVSDGTNTIGAAGSVYAAATTTTAWNFTSPVAEISILEPVRYYAEGSSVDGWVVWRGAGWYCFAQYEGAEYTTSFSVFFAGDVDADRLENVDDEIYFTRRVAGKMYPVGKLALTNDIPDTASIQQDIADLRTESSLVYRLYSGSNVVAEVTNYNSQVHAPELRLMQLNESNEYITVWTETNGLARTYRDSTNYTDAAIAERAAPRAWSGVTAGMGVEAPSNTTWLSTGRTVIAGGLEYEKHLTSGGAIWLLESNGMAADFHPQTNNTAFIDLSNADGTPIFRVEKTDSFLVGVHVDSVTVDGNALVCGVGVVAAEHPLVRVRASLTSGDWAKEEDGIPASLATVEWSGTTGNWTCRITNETGGNQLFAQMEYFQEGGTKIVNSAALDVSAGILCTDGIHKVRPVYNNGTITWEVVQ